MTENGDFLTALGRRVREWRNRRGLTRKQVSEQADVSERHLAQLEAGEGNISVVLLERIAGALEVPIASVFLALTVAAAVVWRLAHAARQVPRAGRVAEIFSQHTVTR